MASFSVRRTAGAAAPRDNRERSCAKLVRRFEAHSLPGAGQPTGSVDIETGEVKTIPLDLSIHRTPEGPHRLHAAHLVDGIAPPRNDRYRN